ncbi:hypothetical protein ES288_A13G032100v1 [Gossypium darwinii]|uniref:U6 snRNA phosphodiesterase 1 n=1 Tax=Gossypium darwinii TaxID=34276 RepID=A0A5D2DVN9_GOSDA|nr:hypothetical protein ES288_A13G032100v1 [Gossypium darwinii]
MEALIATYGDDNSLNSDFNHSPRLSLPANSNPQTEEMLSSPLPLPLPPVSLLHPPNSLMRSFLKELGKVEGNYALHRVSSVVPNFHVVDIDVPLNTLSKEEHKLEQVALGREFHISLGRTVPIRVHQIYSIVTMLRQKLQFQKQYWIDFNKWEVFINDDRTRTFLSLEVVTGELPEITKQIQVVNEVYKLYNLLEFYKDPRPRISLAWALDDVNGSLKKVVEQETKSYVFRGSLQSRYYSICTSKVGGIECKIGNRTHIICKSPNQ